MSGRSRDHDARRVDRVLADQPLERRREVDDLADELVAVVGLPELGALLHAVREVDLRPLGDELRDPVDRAVRDVEHAAGVPDRGPRHHRPEGDDLRDAIAAVLLGDVVDDLVAAEDREVDVDVRHRLATRVQEALEEEVVLDRVDVRDLEAVGDERARRRAAPGPDPDPVPLREGDEVPDDQEVVGEPHLADRLELELEPLLELRRDALVALREPVLAQLDEVVEGVAAVRRREVREQDPAELHRDRAALGELERAGERLGIVREVRGHLRRRLEEELVGVEAPAVRVRERVARLDAEERLVGLGVLVVQVVDVAGRHERQAGPLRDLGELRVDLGLDLETGVLDLDVRRVRSEDLAEPPELHLRFGRVAVLERLADPPREAAGERDEAGRVRAQELPVDARLVVVALEIAERRELDQVRIALVGLGQEGQVRVALPLRAAVVGDVDLAADDRLDAVLSGLPVELDRARERPVVGDRDGRHLELGRARREVRNPACAVEDRVLGVDVEVDERRLGHGQPILGRGVDRTGSAFYSFPARGGDRIATKEEKLEMEGEVLEAFPNGMFKVQLDNGHEALGYTAGKMRRFRIKIFPGDRVKLELSPYDLNRGRIVYRYR